MAKRKHQKKSQNQLHRKFLAISDCNQVLLRADNEQTLLDDICHIICEDAGYGMAWVGYAEHDDAKSITVRSLAGAEKGFLSRNNLTWCDCVEGNCPCGVAVRSGKTAYMQNLCEEEGSAPCVEYAFSSGFRSAIAFPLKDDSAFTFGVLCIYSTQAEAFPPDEVELLEELAGDMAFGINSLRLRTERKEAERQLVASEQLFRTMVENSPDYIARYDRDLRRVYINPTLQKLFSEPVDRLLGKTSENSPSLIEPEYYMANIRRVIETAEECFGEVSFRDVNGDMRWASMRFAPEYDSDGMVASVLVISHDITKRKQAEDRILQSEQRLRLHAELSPLGFLEWDENFCATEWNAACEQIFGYTREEAIGRYAKDLIIPVEIHDLVDGVFHDLMDGSGGRHSINENITKDGRTITCEWFNTTLVNRDGKAIGVASICRDVTELEQAEKERQLHAEFLTNMDRVNRAIQSTSDPETMMSNVLDEVLGIFGCDRAYLLYPCDPNASTWSVPIERTRPEYPGVLEFGLDMPMNDVVTWSMDMVLGSEHPIRVGLGTEYKVAEVLQEQFSIRSFMATALYPRVDKPWQFGIHQCSHDRSWTDQEMVLFEEIGHRLSDGLSSLLTLSNLRESEERFRLVFENSPLPIQEEDYSSVKARLDEIKDVSTDDIESYLKDNPEVVKECAGLVRVVNVNQASVALHESESKEQVLHGLPQVFTSETYDAFRALLVGLADGQKDLVFESILQTLSGRCRKVNIYISVCSGYEHSLGKVLVSIIDITERKRSEERLRLAASVFASSQEGILISDADNHIIDVNPAFTRLTGYTRDEVLGKDPSMLSAGHQTREFYDEMWMAINTQGEWQGEVWNRRKSGEVYAELLSIVAVKDEGGRLQHYVGAFTDISILKEHEAELDHIAHYDMLTSVPNRRLLSDRLDQAIARAKRNGKSLAICYLDLDGFKPINDQFGHEGGDRMLVEIARRLEWISRSDDTVARLGGDEFVLLWNDITSDADCAHALDRVLETVSEPMELDGMPVSISASIGVTLYPDDDVDADTLLRHADQAMYSAKRFGRNHYQMFDIRLERQIASQYEFLTMVERGLESEQFELYYQPKVDCTSGSLYGCEALLRWKDPVLGLVGPSEFLPMIEEDSLAFRVGCWVIDHAVQQARSWNDKGITTPISINLFPCHLKNPSFMDDVHGAIKNYWPEMPKGRLLMEIVESSNLEELDPIEQVINECLTMGIGFSLDDFGTGFSSLVYLRRLSIEELKIDRSFVRDMLNDPDDEAIVEGVIGLGKAFGLRVVAEGVETIDQIRHLRGLGCSIAQGFVLGRPMSVENFEKWYEDFMVNGKERCQ